MTTVYVYTTQTANTGSANTFFSNGVQYRVFVNWSFVPPPTWPQALFDPHQVLELEPGASPQEIRRAYRRLAKLHHPDVGGDPEMFRRITDAYEILRRESDAG